METNTRCRASALPTVSEIPLAKEDGVRDIEDLLQIAVIPADDAKLRAAACALVSDGENTEAPAEQHIKMLSGLNSYRARTPGGIAWKLMMVLNYHDLKNGQWIWPFRLLKSAIVDAVDLERQRQAAPMPTTAVSPELAILIAAHDAALATFLSTEEDMEAEGGGAAYKAAHLGWRQARLAAEAFPARTLADMMAKISLARRAFPDDFPMKTRDSWLFADLERLAKGGAS